MAWWTLVSLLLGLVWWFTRGGRLWTLGNRIPGPPSRPLSGNAHLLWTPPELFLPTISNLFAHHGPVVRLWLFGTLCVLLRDPDDIQTVLNNRDSRNRPRSMTNVFRLFYGSGLVTLEDEQWKVHRRMFTPTFQLRSLKAFMEAFGSHATTLVAQLRKVADGRPVDMISHLGLCTLNTVCDTFMGSSTVSDYPGRSQYFNELSVSNILILYVATRPWFLYCPSLLWLNSMGRKVKHYQKVANEFASWVVSKRIPESLGNPADVEPTFLHSLCEESTFTVTEMKDEVKQMSAAGMGTTALTMGFTLLMVAMHPKIQAELQRELEEVFGGDTRTATFDDLQKLDLLDRCIKETLRLIPVIGMIPRAVVKDIQLPSGPVLPAGSFAVTVSLLAHRDARYFPHPDQYDPDRWLPGNMAAIHPFVYLPYGAGPRICIGQKYAPMVMKVVLSQLLREFSVTTDLDMKTIFTNLVFSMVVTLKEDVGFPIKLTPRKN